MYTITWKKRAERIECELLHPIDWNTIVYSLTAIHVQIEILINQIKCYHKTSRRKKKPFWEWDHMDCV